MDALLKKELKENFLKFVVEFAILVVVAIFLVPYGFRMMKNLAPLLSNLPGGGLNGEAKALLPKLNDLNFFVLSQWFGKNLFEFAIFFGVINSIGAFAGETERKTAIFLFSRPISRTRVLFIKYAVILTGTLIPILLSTYTLPLLARSIPQKINMAVFNRFTVQSLFATAAVVSVSFLFSVVINDRVKGGLVALTALIATILIGKVSALKWVSVMYLYLGKFLPVVSLSIVYSLVFILLSLVLLLRKEF